MIEFYLTVGLLLAGLIGLAVYSHFFLKEYNEEDIFKKEEKP